MSTALSGIVERAILPVVLERMHDEPVLALEGARAVGKSTMLRVIADHQAVEVIDLDDLATRAAVAADPALFMSGPAPVCIDEYQHVPLVLDAIKAELNRDNRPGRFVLTGSTRWDALPRGAQSLTGRLHVLPVRPLAQAELASTRGLVRSLVEHSAQLRTTRTSRTTRAEYVERILAGGFPMALSRAPAARNRWLDDHIATSLERDAREISRIRQAANLPQLLAKLAAQTGQLLNVARAGAEAGMDERTVYGYVHLLERLFLVHRLPAWGRTLRSRVTASPKLHVVDSGIAARLLGLSSAKLSARSPAALSEFGHLLETFAYGEVAAQASWLEDVRPLGHWRTREGHEVDLVLERDDGGVIAMEIKSSARATGIDLAGLRRLRDLLGQQFVTGVVFYTGARSYEAEDRLYVVPMDRLWTG